MSTVIFPDYSNSLINLMASIQRYYGLETDVSTLPLSDHFLQGNYTNIVLMVLDGLGSFVLDASLKAKKSFLLQHKAGDFLSVFPPTTTAAINSILSTKPPVQHGWLGWHQYFKEIDEDIILFKNCGYYHEDYVPPYAVAKEALPYKSILDMLQEKGIKTKSIHPYWAEDGAINFDVFCSRVANFCRGSEQKFMYAYWDEPDATLHQKGVGSRAVKILISEMEERLEKLTKELDDDTLVLIVADHGHINIKNINLYEDKTIQSMLALPPSIEARCTTFFVKKEHRLMFPVVFNHRYGRHFKLLRRDEVDYLKLFGPGPKHSRFDDFIGDYVAIAVDSYAFFYSSTKQKHRPFRATHAGMTAQEMVIPLIVLKSERR